MFKTLSLLGNTETKAQFTYSENDTSENRDIFQALFIPNRKGTNLLRWE